MNKIIKELENFRKLKKGWDGYKAVPIDEVCIQFGIFLMDTTTDKQIEKTKLKAVPTSTGGVQFSVIEKDIELTVNIKKRIKKGKHGK